MYNIQNKVHNCDITVIWGSMSIAQRFVHFHENEVDFFVDNDQTRCGKVILGKKVIHPSEISDWKNVFVYIQDTYKADIVPQILKLGVAEENYDFYSCFVGVGENRMLWNMNDCIEKLKKDSSIRHGGIMAFFTNTANRSQKFFDILLNMNCTTIIFENYMELNGLKVRGKLYDVPDILCPSLYIDKVNKDDCHILVDVDDIPVINTAISQIRYEFNIEVELATATANNIYIAFEKVVEIFKPKFMILPPFVCHSFRIFETLCIKNDIEYVSFEAGVIPGTLCFDVVGAVGKSLPSIYWEKFKNLPLDNNDINKAKTIWKNQYEKKLNRKRQPKIDVISSLNVKLMKNRPIVFFAAQNDVCSRMIPYIEETRKYYSPVFKSSIDAGIYLAKLCEKNNWNFIYKPHPMYIREEQIKQLPPNTIYVDYCDINDLIDISDVVITILSTTNYDAMMRYKPVVMLGYNWSHGQGCTYEAFSEDVIEDTIKQAIEKGFTEEMQQAFLENIARLCKYYLYDDMSDRELRYGKPLPDDYEGFFELQRMLEEME